MVGWTVFIRGGISGVRSLNLSLGLAPVGETAGSVRIIIVFAFTRLGHLGFDGPPRHLVPFISFRGLYFVVPRLTGE